MLGGTLSTGSSLPACALRTRGRGRRGSASARARRHRHAAGEPPASRPAPSVERILPAPEFLHAGESELRLQRQAAAILAEPPARGDFERLLQRGRVDEATTFQRHEVRPRSAQASRRRRRPAPPGSRRRARRRACETCREPREETTPAEERAPPAAVRGGAGPRTSREQPLGDRRREHLIEGARQRAAGEQEALETSASARGRSPARP